MQLTHYIDYPLRQNEEEELRKRSSNKRYLAYAESFTKA